MQSYMPPLASVSELRQIVELIKDPKKTKEILGQLEDTLKELHAQSASVSIREAAVREKEQSIDELKSSSEAKHAEIEIKLNEAKAASANAVMFLDDSKKKHREFNEIKEKAEQEIASKKEEIAALHRQVQASVDKALFDQEQALALKSEYEQKLEKLKAMVG